MRTKYLEKSGFYKQTQLFNKGWRLNDIKLLLTRRTCQIIETPIMTYYKIEDVDRIMAKNAKHFSKRNTIDDSDRKTPKSECTLKSFNKSVNKLNFPNGSNIMEKIVKISKDVFIDDRDNGQSLKMLVDMAITHYNEIHYSKNMLSIDLDEELINTMVNQYELIDHYIKTDSIQTVQDELGLAKIKHHGTTIFMSRIILMYLYNKWYRRLSKKAQKFNCNLSKGAKILLVYDYMVQKCAVLDTIPSLTLAHKRFKKLQKVA